MGRFRERERNTRDRIDLRAFRMRKDAAGFVGNGGSQGIAALALESEGTALAAQRAIQNVGELGGFAVLFRRPDDVVAVERCRSVSQRDGFVRVGRFRQVKGQVKHRVYGHGFGQRCFFSSDVFRRRGQGIDAVLFKLNSTALQPKASGDGVSKLHRLFGAVRGGFGQRPRKALCVFPYRHDLDLGIGMGSFRQLEPYLRVRVIIGATGITGIRASGSWCRGRCWCWLLRLTGGRCRLFRITWGRGIRRRGRWCWRDRLRIGLAGHIVGLALGHRIVGVELAVAGIPDDPVFFSDDGIALVIIRDIRLVVITAVPLGVFCFIVLALYPHQHFDNLGAGDRFVRFEAVRVICGIDDSGVDECLNVLFRPMPVNVGEGRRVLHRASRVQLQLLRQIRGKFPAGDDVVFPDEALRV
ncbi:hypothetical protein SDC9_50737 [bioreactor metagenome]|uniref:Uncharacterized protein n=1 Tax=bioreactor metagenome TaxID=1076179 RepID=A0A644WL01_9ZZZZ